MILLYFPVNDIHSCKRLEMKLADFKKNGNLKNAEKLSIFELDKPF